MNRPWGKYRILLETPYCKVKQITIHPGKSTSLQLHKHRNEHWVFPTDNHYEFHEKNSLHKLTNNTDQDMIVIEVQTGEYFGEDDIVRFK